MKAMLNLALVAALATVVFAREIGNNNHHREKRSPKIPFYLIASRNPWLLAGRPGSFCGNLLALLAAAQTFWFLFRSISILLSLGNRESHVFTYGHNDYMGSF